MKQPQPSVPLPARIEVLDFLRGIASLAVAFHHFGNILNPGILAETATYARFGVQVFFVISGFIIPYSLYKSRYTISNYFRFVIKRIVRLDPPYLGSIAVVLLLGLFSWIAPGGNGEFHFSFTQVVLHFGYLNAYFHYPWLNDVYWTLALEFQYYLLIGLLFPILFSKTTWLRLVSMAGLGSLCFVFHSQDLVFEFILLFCMGIVISQYWIGLIGKTQCAGLLLFLVPVTLYGNGWPTLIAGEFAVCSILFLRIRNPVFTFLGNISYSLYLLHSPVGRRALNFGLRFTHSDAQSSKLAAIAFAFAVSIVAAYIFYVFVEKPAREWSRAVTYRRNPRSEQTTEIESGLSVAAFEVVS